MTPEFDPNQTGDITLHSRVFIEYLEKAAERGGTRALEIHTSKMKCGGCFVTPDAFPGDPHEKLKERLSEHAEDHRWMRFWRKVSDATVFRLASMLVIGAILAAFGGLAVAFKFGGMKL